MSAPHPQELLRAYLVKHGLKASRQREIIADVFFRSGGHQRIDDLLQQVRSIDPRVSQATVYRTMKLLTDCGLAKAHNFLDGQTRYERSDAEVHQHDHLICTACGRIVEFMDSRLEALQAHVATSHGFVVSHHKMELYGECAACREAAAG